MATAIINSQMDAINESFSNISSDLTTIRPLLKNATIGAYPTDTSSGSIASFSDGAEGIPVKSLSVDLEPIQSGSGDPSPTNIRPISGHTEVNVYRTGKNLFDFKSDYSGWGGGYIKTDGTASGTTPTAPAYERVSPFIGIEGGTAYTFSVNVDTTSQKSMNWALYDADKNFISGTHGGQYSSAPVTVIAPSTAAYFRVSLRTYNIAKDYQLELGSTATDYEPYAGQTYNVPLGQTVYGGTLNVTTGVLTINRAITTIGALNWAYYTSDSTFRSSSLVDSILTNSAYIDCEAFKQVAASAGATSDMCIWVTSGGGLRIKNSNYTDSSAFKTAFTDTQFTYELATPITVQLTATQVSTLLGENNVWSDAGTVSVVYRADTGLYIDKKLAQALNA